MFCKHLDLETSSMGSEWTGRYGEDGFTCRAGKFSEYDAGKTNTIEDMRALFLRAETCDSYEQA